MTKHLLHPNYNFGTVQVCLRRSFFFSPVLFALIIFSLVRSSLFSRSSSIPRRHRSPVPSSTPPLLALALHYSTELLLTRTQSTTRTSTPARTISVLEMGSFFVLLIVVTYLTSVRLEFC